VERRWGTGRRDPADLGDHRRLLVPSPRQGNGRIGTVVQARASLGRDPPGDTVLVR